MTGRSDIDDYAIVAAKVYLQNEEEFPDADERAA
jgi:hypothetical protein